ncbi:MAG: hypothetical protein AAF772_15580, partial [Acidobacteriota bacterium]
DDGGVAAVRPGTYARRVLLSDRPAIVRLAAGLSYLLDYPHGCTEQRLSRAHAWVASRAFRDRLGLIGSGAGEAAVVDTLGWLGQVTGDDGRVAFWPGDVGSVPLTAWASLFVTEARAAGYDVDRDLEARLLDGLARALRSDAAGASVDGGDWAARTWALRALAAAGRFDPAYGAELTRRASQLDLEGQALTLLAFADAGALERPEQMAGLDALRRAVADGLVLDRREGKTVVTGLRRTPDVDDPYLLPSETRALAEVARALYRLPSADAEVEARRAAALDALLLRADGAGWGTTNATAAALGALTTALGAPDDDERPAPRVALRIGEMAIDHALDDGVRALDLDAPTPATLVPAADAPSLAARVDVRWLPRASGAEAEAVQRGFSVERTASIGVERTDVAPRRVTPGEDAAAIDVALGAVIEERVRLINPADRYHVALEVPLAAGVELLDPSLATAPPEARPSQPPTLAPTWVDRRDDRAIFYYTVLPQGTYDVYLRVRATTPGHFVQPPARAELMYDDGVWGRSAGSWLKVADAAATDENPADGAR